MAIGHRYPSSRYSLLDYDRDRGIDLGLVRVQKIVYPQKWRTNRTTEVADDGLCSEQIPRKGWVVGCFSLDGMPYRTVSFNGTVMRHFFVLLLTIASLSGSMIQPALPTFLVTF